MAELFSEVDLPLMAEVAREFFNEVMTDDAKRASLIETLNDMALLVQKRRTNVACLAALMTAADMLSFAKTPADSGRPRTPLDASDVAVLCTLATHSAKWCNDGLGSDNFHTAPMAEG